MRDWFCIIVLGTTHAAKGVSSAEKGQWLTCCDRN